MSETHINMSQSSRDDGAFLALEQLSGWVRFADNKATILTAGLGAIVTILMTNAKMILSAVSTEVSLGRVLLVTLIATGIALFLTSFWLMCAIQPSSRSSATGVNRFAWPTLTNHGVNDLLNHVQETTPREDAWQQVVDLAQVAEKKFSACRRAITSFFTFMFLSLMAIILAIILTSSGG